jgi:hypothetical protein
MMRKIFLNVALGPGAVVGFLFFASGGPLFAQPAGDASGDDSGVARMKVMARNARSFKLTVSDKPVLLLAEPIFRYDDKARNIQDSTIWAWGASGRPSAVLKLEVNPARPTDRHWLYSIVSLSRETTVGNGPRGSPALSCWISPRHPRRLEPNPSASDR